jgi:hypothetical protein
MEMGTYGPPACGNTSREARFGRRSQAQFKNRTATVDRGRGRSSVACEKRSAAGHHWFPTRSVPHEAGGQPLRVSRRTSSRSGSMLPNQTAWSV